MTIYEAYPPIRSTFLFCDVSENIVNRYITERSLCITEYSEGEIICSPNVEKSEIGIIIHGSARAHSGDSTDHTLLRTLHAGDMFGIANLYADDEPFPSLIIAKESCFVLRIDGHAFKDLIEHEPTVLRKYLTLQSKKIVYLNRKIMTLTAGDAEKKLAVFLLEREDTMPNSPIRSMSDLANLLGMGRASLYRAIDSLIKNGLIEKESKYLKIRDRLLLEHYINQ